MLIFIGTMLLLAGSAMPQERETTGDLTGTVRRSGSRRPITGADVVLVGTNHRATTDSIGAFMLRDLPAGRWRVRATAPAHRPYEAFVDMSAATVVRLDIELEPLPPELPPVDVVGARGAASEAARTRDLFDATVLPAVTTVSRREMRLLPTIVEPDVLRALQSLPGGVVLNDFDAQLYVRGGAPDQNQIFLDGARVFGAYHMFGMSGVFNADAVENVDFFRGGRPSRYGGSLGAIVEVEQRDGDADARAEGGLSMLGARVMLRGASESRGTRWMVAGRRTHADVAMDDGIPYAFHDVQGRLRLLADSSNEVTLSAFTSGDRFRVGFDETKVVRSGSANRMASLRWRRRGGSWTSRWTAWASAYDAHLDAGDDRATRTSDAIRLGGVRGEGFRAIGSAGLRIGAEVETGRVSLTGADTHGGFFVGEERSSYVAPAVHGELDWRVGRVRLAPALRVAHAPAANAVLAEPRLGARLELNDRAWVTATVSRSHQWLSSLRDERMLLPGPALWFVHPDSAPVSRADDAALELTTWLSDEWTVSLGGYLRRFEDRASWRPASERDLESMSWDDGRSSGIELSARRFGESVSAWAGYTLSRTRFREDGTGALYAVPWDRRHSFNGAMLWKVASRFHVSADARYGSGNPSWPFIGSVVTPLLDPLVGGLQTMATSPLWGNTQVRHDPYLRVDAGVRTSFHVSRVAIEPYLSLQNMSFSRNVLYYEATRRGPPALDPVALPGFFIPTVGFNVRF